MWKITSPDGNNASQIDHVIINQKYRQSLQDIKPSHGADVGRDHVLVVAKSLKLRKTKRGEERQRRFDTAKEKNINTGKAFQLDL